MMKTFLMFLGKTFRASLKCQQYENKCSGPKILLAFSDELMESIQRLTVLPNLRRGREQLLRRFLQFFCLHFKELLT